VTDGTTITVLGAGAMGAFYGAKLANAGADVILLDVSEPHIAAINENGLRLADPDGSERHTPMVASDARTALVRPADFVIVFVDTNALAEAALTIPNLLNPKGCVLTLQNGVGNVETLSDKLGSERVIGGTSMNSCELLGPGHVRHVIHGETVLGEVDGNAVSDRIQCVADLLSRHDDKVACVTNIIPHIWSKVAINCAVNPLCALTGLLPGQLQNVPELKALQVEIATEIEALCAAKNIVLPEEDLIGSIWAKSKGGNNKPSMVQHLERKRRTEIDALNGAVARMSHEAGLNAPVNSTVAAGIKGLEACILR
jgi:2-dehydropantoate 2-reductase